MNKELETRLQELVAAETFTLEDAIRELTKIVEKQLEKEQKLKKTYQHELILNSRGSGKTYRMINSIIQNGYNNYIQIRRHQNR